MAKKDIPSIASSKRKSVDIRKANNGCVVSSWTDKGEDVMIAKTKEEAKNYATTMLGIK